MNAKHGTFRCLSINFSKIFFTFCSFSYRPFFEGLIFGGAFIRRGLSREGNLRFKIDWVSLIVGSKSTVFALFYVIFEGKFPSTSPPGGGLIFGRAICRRVFCITGLRGLYLERLIF